MPKGKKKGKHGGRRNPDSRQPSDEEYDTADNASIISGQSETASLGQIAEGGDPEVDEISQQEEFEDKLKDCIDGTTQKSAKGRTQCLQSLVAAMSKKYIYDFIIERKITITDCVERCLRKGKGEEQAMAAKCATVLCVQLGSSDDSEAVFKTLAPIWTTIMLDTSASSTARAACATALGVCSFLVVREFERILHSMHTLEKVFKGSYLKGDGSAPSHTPEVAALHTSAITAWSLLLSIALASTVDSFIDSHLGKLPQLLESPDVDLRCAAGEAIALLYELAREEDENFEGDDMDELCELLKQLATDSNKYRAKKDRRQQRSSFRDILRAVEEGEAPAQRIRFGREYITIDSWARKMQYDALCHTLLSGMNIHLQENELIRDIFGLGPPLPIGLPVQKISRNERHQYNAAAFKARTKARAKVRDKRAVAMHAFPS